VATIYKEENFMEYRSWHDHYDYDVPISMRYPRILAHDVLQIPANACPDRTAILYEGQTITFWELRQMVLRMANALKNFGVEKGERVGLHLPTCPQYVIAYRAVLSLGAIIVNLNPIYPAEELLHIARQTKISTLITIDKALPQVRLLCKEFNISRVIVSRTDDFTGHEKKADMTDLDPGWHSFMDILGGCSDTGRIQVSITPEDPAVIQFTGGTTGIPKGAILTHKNIVTTIVQLSTWYLPRVKLSPPENRSTLIALPIYHVYGNLASNWALYNCALQILVPQFEINTVLEVINSVPEVTYFPAVPTMLSAIVNHPKAKEMEIGKKIGFVNCGAAPCPLELIEQVKDAGIYLTEGWAMSETSCVGTGNPIRGMKKAGSIGFPFIDTDIKLVDLDDGVKEVPQGEPGEMLIKGPQIMKGYWENPEETANQLRDGWLSTGDVAIMDKDGYLFIVDRKKDMIIAGGFNIYPREIDEILHQHPKVKMAISVGIPDKYRGETVKAYVVLREGEKASQEEIIAFCKNKLTAYKVPKIVEFRDSLPQSSVGKILRKTLRDEEMAKIEK
jgi:long-chain acyl-CoA synthetase